MNITCTATHPAPFGARPRRRTGTAIRQLAISLLAMAATAASAQFITPPKDWVKHRVMPDDFMSITAGNYHTCATRFDGRTYCWGRNDLGQSGVAGTKTCKGPYAGPGTACVDRPEYVLTATQVEAGAEHTCALDAGGAAFCWGNSHRGQLGTGHYKDMVTPEAVNGGLSFSSISGSNPTCRDAEGRIGGLLATDRCRALFGIEHQEQPRTQLTSCDLATMNENTIFIRP